MTQSSTSRTEPPYARYALLNPYNLTLFAGGVVLGLATGHGWLVVITCAAEAMWIIFAPDSKLLRAIWFDRSLAAASEAAAQDRRAEKLTLLGREDLARFTNLAAQKKLAVRLAEENPSLTAELLAAEVAKLDALLEDFVDLAVRARRAELHAQSFDFAAMQRSWHVYGAQLRACSPGDPRRDVAEKNLEVLRQRRARFDDLGRIVELTRGQMELIEQTFRLLSDEMHTLTSPTELGARIDEVRVALDVAREANEAELMRDGEDPSRGEVGR